MKKIIFIPVFFAIVNIATAQIDSAKSAVDSTLRISPAETVVNTTHKPKKQYNLANRTNDHFMIQLGYTSWTGMPDSIKTRGFSRSINTYFMFDFPFKATPQLSVGIGLGIGTDNIIFKKSHPDVKGTTTTMRFNGPDTALFKKTKLMTAYLEAPVELRYVKDPEHSDKSFKAALGIKVGTMLKAGTRSRALASYIEKESSKRYFNTYRIAGTARVGWGNFTVFGTYQFTPLLKDAAGPSVKPFTIGLTISGL